MTCDTGRQLGVRRSGIGMVITGVLLARLRDAGLAVYVALGQPAT